MRFYKIFINFLYRAGVRVISGHHGHGEVDNSLKGAVGMFAHLVLGMFRYLDSHRSTPLLELFPVSNYILFL